MKKKETKSKEQYSTTQNIVMKNENSNAALLPRVNKKYQLTPIEAEFERGTGIASFLGIKSEEPFQCSQEEDQRILVYNKENQSENEQEEVKEHKRKKAKPKPKVLATKDISVAMLASSIRDDEDFFAAPIESKRSKLSSSSF